MVVELLAAAGGDAAVEGDVERVEGGFPAVGPAGAAPAGGGEGADGQGQHFQRRLFGLRWRIRRVSLPAWSALVLNAVVEGWQGSMIWGGGDVVVAARGSRNTCGDRACGAGGVPGRSVLYAGARRARSAVHR